MTLFLPLALLGLGLLVYYLLVAATHALPLAIGVAAGLAASSAGLPAPAAMLTGAAAFFISIAAVRFVVLTTPSANARIALIAAFAIPAMIAGTAVGHALADLAGIGGLAMVTGLVSGLACGFVSALRLVGREA